MEEFILQQNETYEFKYNPEKGRKFEKRFKNIIQRLENQAAF